MQKTFDFCIAPRTMCRQGFFNIPLLMKQWASVLKASSVSCKTYENPDVTQLSVSEIISFNFLAIVSKWHTFLGPVV